MKTLESEFVALKVEEEDSMDHFARQLMGMSVQYGNLGGSLDDQAFVKKLFDTMPERYINLVLGIEQSMI